MKVAIIMGSDSDLPIMVEAEKILNELDIRSTVSIVSAHRTPDKLVEFAKNAHMDGISVIIAGAGGAAHLPGMVASFTPLPVIGVPINTTPLQGIDSLHSIVQMPAGVPVATVAINGAKNAGILAAQILGASNPAVQERILLYKKAINEEVLDKAERLESIGTTKYLEKQ